MSSYESGIFSPADADDYLAVTYYKMVAQLETFAAETKSDYLEHAERFGFTPDPEVLRVLDDTFGLGSRQL